MLYTISITITDTKGIGPPTHHQNHSTETDYLFTDMTLQHKYILAIIA